LAGGAFCACTKPRLGRRALLERRCRCGSPAIALSSAARRLDIGADPASSSGDSVTALPAAASLRTARSRDAPPPRLSSRCGSNVDELAGRVVDARPSAAGSRLLEVAAIGVPTALCRFRGERRGLARLGPGSHFVAEPLEQRPPRRSVGDADVGGVGIVAQRSTVSTE
jgi:hypothetical protein